MKDRTIESEFAQYGNRQRVVVFGDPHELSRHEEETLKLAEHAFHGGNVGVARSLVEEYLQLDPQRNHFFCRAKILLALIIHAEAKELTGPLSVSRRGEAVQELLAAVDIATAPQHLSRYQFVVFNASLALWKIARAFLRPGRARHFVKPFERLANALEAQDDREKDWRVQFLCATAFCAGDDNNAKGASDFMDKAVALQESLLNTTLAEERKIDAQLQRCKEKVDSLMAAFRAIEEREELLRKPRKIDPDLEPDDEYYTRPLELPPLEGLAAEGKERVKALLDAEQADKAKLEQKMRSVVETRKTQSEMLIRCFRERVAVNPADAKRFSALPNVTKDLRTLSLVQIQCIQSNVITEKEVDAALAAMLKKLEDAPASEARSETLLDLSRFCWTSRQPATAQRAMEIASNASTPISRVLRVKLDVCEALKALSVIDSQAHAAAQQVLMSAKQIEGLRIAKRLEAIKTLERTLAMSLPVLEDKFVVQEICLVMWNAVLPLLTTKLRAKVHSALKTLTASLEAIDCLSLPLFRSLAHYELALCEDAADYSGLALEEMQKSCTQDFGEADVAKTRKADDKESLDGNRVQDQFLQPFKDSLALRVDVYGTPSRIDEQVVLWLQQARESSSKSFVLETVTKCAFMLLREMDKDDLGLAPSLHTETVDWSLEVMKFGKLSVSLPPLQEIENSLAGSASKQADFSFSLNARLENLVRICELAHSAQDARVLQSAAQHVLCYRWELSTPHAALLIASQIECCCWLAESFSFRIQGELAALIKPTKAGKKAAQALPVAEALRKESVLGVQCTSSSEIAGCKRLLVLALRKAFSLALELKDVFAAQNVLIYFWNLHLHVFRDAELCVQIIDEVIEFLKLATSSAELLVSFPRATEYLDAKLVLSFFEALASMYFAKNRAAEALETASKGLTIPLPGVLVNSSLNAYLRKTLVERASVYNVTVAAAAPVNAKAKDAPVVGPFVVADNPLLSVFANLSLAEPSPSLSQLSRDVSEAALERATQLMRGDAFALVQREEVAEAKGETRRARESHQQRLEMLLEAYSRISRLFIARGDFVASQDWAELALKRFYSSERVSDDEDLISESESKQMNSRISRWISNAEQCMAFAIAAFLESSSQQSAAVGRDSNTKRSAPASLDPELVQRLQSVALQHLLPAVRFAVVADERSLVINATSLAVLFLQRLLGKDEYFSSAFDTGSAIAKELRRRREDRQCQSLLRDVYLALVTGLVLRREYDRGLKLIVSAFEVIDADLQRDLWPARVVCMTRKGLSVLDGLQRLKESDPLLQARVLVLFARCTSDLSTQLSVFLQAIEMLDTHPEKIDYLLELAEIMANAGIARNDVKAPLSAALSALLSVEENEYDEVKDWTEEDEQLPMARARSVATAKTQTSAKRSTAVSQAPSASASARTRTQQNNTSTGANRSRANTAAGSLSQSVGGDPKTLTQAQTRLDFRALEQAARAYTMNVALEAQHSVRLRCVLMAVYFAKRAFELWIETLQAVHKKEKFDAAQAAQESKGEDLSEFNVVYPVHLQMPRTALAVLRWVDHIELRDATWAALRLPAHSASLPSAQSLPNFAATVVQLFALLRYCVEYRLFDEALYLCAFVKMLLWTTPVDTGSLSAPLTTPADRSAPLLLLHLTVIQIVQQLGDSAAEIASPSSFILQGDERLSPGELIRRFLDEHNRTHVRRDLPREQLFDLAYRELLQHLQSQTNAQTQSVLRRGVSIATVAQEFDSLQALDPLFFWIAACECMLDNEQFSVAEQLIAALLWETRSKRLARHFASVAGLLLRLLHAKGDFDNCISVALRQREILQCVGDVALLKTHFSAALRSYFSAGLAEEGKQLFEVVSAMVRDLALRTNKPSDEPQNNNAQQALRGSSSKATMLSQTSQTNSLAGKSLAVTETGLDYVAAWKEMALQFIEISLGELFKRLCDGSGFLSDKAKGEAMNIFASVDAVVALSVEMVRQTCGESSLWEMQLEALRASKTVHFLRSCRLTQSESQVLSKSLQQSFAIARQWLQSFTRTAQRFPALTPRDDVFSLTPETTLSLENDHDLAVNNVLEGCSDRGVALLYGLVEFQSAVADLSALIDRGEHKSPTDFSAAQRREPSVIDKFLAETDTPTELSEQALDLSSALRVQQRALQAAALLRGTKHEPFAELAATAALTADLIANREFDANWLLHDEALPHTLVSTDAVDCQKKLQRQLAALMDTDMRESESLLSLSSAILLESLGVAQAQSAGQSLFWLQSLRAKWWLFDMWSAAVHKKSPLGVSLANMTRILESNFPAAHELKALHKEKAFLSQTSSSFKRLSIATVPEQVFHTVDQQLPDSSLLLCVQLCPYWKTLYVSCYKPTKTESESAATAGKPAKGAAPPPVPVPVHSATQWFFDKMELSAEQRRALQVLLEQVQEWQLDVSKFVAVQGEHTSDEYEPSDSAKPLGVAHKLEHALDERFRAIVFDFDALLERIFGTNSRLSQYFSEHQNSGKPLSLSLFIDPSLLSLPWEALTLLESNFKRSVSRDFSLHLLLHRLESTKALGGNTVSAAGVKLVVDPLGEDNQLSSSSHVDERKNLQDFWSTLLRDLKTTSKWTALRSGDGLLSSEDFFALDTSSAALRPPPKNHSLLVNVFGRFANFFPPQQIATMSLERLVFVLCLDNAHCERSFRRQNSEDILKNREELELEGSLKMAALMSLAGCACVATTAWTTPLKSQHRIAESVLKHFTDSKKETLVECMGHSCVDIPKLKRFVKFSNVMYGITTLTYID